MILLRPALDDDIKALYVLDAVTSQSEERRDFIRRSVAAKTCYAAVLGEEVIGYGVLNYTFYEHGFIHMLYVGRGHRRQQVGSRLLAHMETHCETSKLFTSTNLSNLPMQSLLVKNGYLLSGLINNLDDGDPEIVYFKRIPYRFTA